MRTWLSISGVAGSSACRPSPVWVATGTVTVATKVNTRVSTPIRRRIAGHAATSAEASAAAGSSTTTAWITRTWVGRPKIVAGMRREAAQPG